MPEKTPGEVYVPPTASATVLRFSPVSAEAMLKKAGQAFRDCGAYRLSVFVSDARDGEDQEAVINRILTASELQGIKPENNEKFWWLAEAGRITEAGYSLVKYGFEGEIAEHHSIELGKSASIEDTERIRSLFTPRRRDEHERSSGD